MEVNAVFHCELLSSEIERVRARRRRAELRFAQGPVIPIAAACVLTLLGWAIVAAVFIAMVR